jgi:hypothetical protein
MSKPKYNLLNAIIYELLLNLIEYLPGVKHNTWVVLIMTNCFPDWVEWKTEKTMKHVDRQVEEIKETWKKQENKEIVERFQGKYPEAKVTLHDANTGAVLIEHPPDGSKAQELLGGAMEIKSPWSK